MHIQGSTSRLFACCLTLLLLVFAAGPCHAQLPLELREFVPIFVDNQGDTIPSNPALLPFKIVNGFPEYRLGPGDILEIITLEGGERLREEARILPDGTVSFSVVNNVPVAGLGLSEATRILRAELGRYVRMPYVQLLVSEYRSKSVSVLGSINFQTVTLSGARTGPGVYPLKGRIHALDQLLEAGGPTPDARLDQVRLIRSNHTYVIDLQRAISHGDNSQNPILQHGDVLQIPGIAQADRRIAVLGEVAQAGVFNLSSEANMLEAIAACRGFTQDASANRIRVIRRINPTNPEIYTINAERILSGDLSQNLPLVDGDIVVVPRDWLTDLNDLLAQLTPILAWGGLVRTEPVVNVGGYDFSFPGGSEPTPTVPVTETGGLLQQPESVQQQVLEQVQRNLQKPAP